MPLNKAGKCLRALLLPGQERLHFNHETDARRQQILDVVAEFHPMVDLYRADRDTLLWIPDAVAWAWARGGLWRQRVAQFCEERGP